MSFQDELFPPPTFSQTRENDLAKQKRLTLELLEPRMMLSTVQVIATGSQGVEQMELQIDAGVVEARELTVRVQDIDNLSGKVLRIDPITGQGLTDNPCYRGDTNENRAKVYQSGLRNPFRMTVDPVSGQLYIGEVGWTQWEEVNAGGSGANFGWPYYEGGSGVSFQTFGYQDSTSNTREL